MAYKDEYEVARLYTDGQFAEKLAQQFEGDFRIEFNLAPPLLAKKDFRELSPDDWSRAIDANMLSTIALITASVDGMMTRGFGRIVNITSMTSVRPFINLDLSNARRLGVTGFVADVSRQVAGSNVTINNLLPVVRHRAGALAGGEAKEIIATIPAGRLGIQGIRLYLHFSMQRLGGYMTGQKVLIDGGFCMNTL